MIIIAAVNGDDTIVNDQPDSIAAASSGNDTFSSPTWATILVKKVTLIIGLTPTWARITISMSTTAGNQLPRATSKEATPPSWAGSSSATLR